MWFVLLVFGDAYAQDTINKTPKRSRFILSKSSSSDTLGDNKVFVIVQQQPKFPGDISKYLTEHISYPENARNRNIQGTVYVSFIVEGDGEISGAQILRGVDKSLNDEAIRVVSAMPKWTPGMQNGHIVRVQYMLPIRFILTDNTQNSDPKFPYELSNWISKQAEYPEDALKNKIEGTVYVHFTVRDDGSVAKNQNR